jgi:hypothetical protein
MENIYKCPKCGERELFQFTYDYSKAHRPVINILCNNCGEMFPPALKLPKETPKQETIEETAARLFTEEKYPTFFETFRKAFISSAKFNTAKSERMYSEEEVLNIIVYCDGSLTQAKKWFEQFKKK